MTWIVASWGWVISSQRFEQTCRPLPQAFEKIHVHMTLNIKAVLLFETSGSNYPTKRRNNPETYFFTTTTSLQLIKHFTACHVRGVMRQASRMTSAVSFAAQFFLSRLLDTRPNVWLCYEPHTLEERETIRKNTVEKQHCLLSVSLPHSHDSNGKV